MRDPATRDLATRHRRSDPSGIAFVSLGLFFGTWAVTAADIEDALGLGHGAFGALLAVALVGTVTTSTLTGALVERFGTGVVLGWGALAFAVATAAVGLGGGAPVPLAIATVCVYSCSGVVDVAMNVAAAASLAEEPGQLVRFHALFNGGATVGAAAAALREPHDRRVAPRVRGAGAGHAGRRGRLPGRWRAVGAAGRAPRTAALVARRAP